MINRNTWQLYFPQEKSVSIKMNIKKSESLETLINMLTLLFLYNDFEKLGYNHKLFISLKIRKHILEKRKRKWW